MTIRLIADENLSWRIKKQLPEWEILPANEINADRRISDSAIWKFAKTNHYHILTFDEDFTELQNLYSYPPKIIWLRLGNRSTKEIANRLLELQTAIHDFLNNLDIGVYEVYL